MMRLTKSVYFVYFLNLRFIFAFDKRDDECSNILRFPLGAGHFRGEKCRFRDIYTTLAISEERLIYSPGYPQNYEINDNCTWIISIPSQATDQILQLVTVDIDVNDRNNDCNTDYLVAYEGTSVAGPVIAKWCGNDKKIIKSNQSVTLRFHSDGQYTGRGFAISYSFIPISRSECKEGQDGRIYVGPSPVYEYFQGKSSPQSCKWEIISTDPQKKLLFELFKPSNVSCNDGSFEFYDGRDTASHVSFLYCSTKKPFSLMFLKSKKVALVFLNKVRREPDSLALKISIYSPLYNCTLSRMPTIEVKDGPAIFALPLANKNWRTPCPVRLLIQDKQKHLRLDVMGTDKGESDCNTDVLDVKEENSQKSVRRSCNRGKNPVYHQSSSAGFVVTSKLHAESNVYLRAAAVDWQCDGSIIRRTASDSVVREELIPEHGDYSDLAYCKYLISGEGDHEIIRLSLSWNAVNFEHNPNTQTAECNGDYINIYDGNSEEFPVLFSSCWQHSIKDINTTVISSQRHLLLVLNADAKINGKSARVRYHSVPANEHCSNVTEISVTRDVHVIESPNYPGRFYMFNH